MGMLILGIDNTSEMFNHKINIMKVDVHAVNFTVDRKLVDFIQERMDKLEKYYDRVVSADVFLKVERTSDKENKAVEIKINVPGDDFLVKKQCKTFEEAIELSAESLERLLVKRKEKIRAHI
ncbi:putative sigma-54 modulation protein [Flavobacterium saccharophilum]|uniref:Putative sigma-54 modulation protein n=2 Tax=Flavobacteriaceae TaxID=49546 RepID=A0A1M7L489_9FLAO|nr:putative sigma-54 modulation protein [Flavobacterium saccharophilum]